MSYRTARDFFEYALVVSVAAVAVATTWVLASVLAAVPMTAGAPVLLVAGLGFAVASAVGLGLTHMAALDRPDSMAWSRPNLSDVRVTEACANPYAARPWGR